MHDLPTVWFILVGVLLTGYAILDGFDLGVGTLHLFVARDDRERRLALNAVGPVWDGNEVWLLTGGGALFAAFPDVYATVFSGMYVAVMLLLVAFIARAVSMELRSKEEAPAWRRFWDVAFALGSFVAALLLGVALGNVLRGLLLTSEGEYAGTFLDLLNPFAVTVGVLSVALFSLHGAVWLELKTEGALRERAGRAADYAHAAVLLLWTAATLASRSAAPHLWAAYDKGPAWIAPAVLVSALLALPAVRRRGGPAAAFTVSAVGIASLMAIVGQGLYPHLVPALGGLNDGLTVAGAASSALTLRTMLLVALLGMPVVIGYTIFVYYSFRGPVVLDDASY
jgi:cytochrome d ubiquinol oxidase subunit II